MSNSQFSMASLNQALDTTTTDASIAVSANDDKTLAVTISDQQATSTSTVAVPASLALVAPVAQMVPPVPEAEFFLYKKLPLELRLEIMDLVCAFVRVITIHEDDKVNTHTFDGRSRIWRNYRAKATCITGRLPTVLHINKEFRTYGLKFYKTAFRHRLHNKPIYFNFDVDVLYIPDEAAWKSLSKSKVAPFSGFIKAVSNRIKHLVIKGSVTDRMWTFLGGVFGGLETLVLETHGGHRDGLATFLLHNAWEKVLKEQNPSAELKFPVIEFLSEGQIRARYVSRTCQRLK